jgi:hypothetical protein
LVQFGFFPIQTGSNQNYSGFVFSRLFIDHIFQGFYFCTCFHFLENHPIFFLLDPCLEVKPSKKIHKTKGKKRSNLTAKKKRENQKLLKCKTIKSLLFEPKKTDCKKST